MMMIATEYGDKSLKRAALVVITLASFLFPFLASAVNIAIPSIGKDMHMSAVALNWVAATFLLSAAIFSIPFGRAADIYGRRKFLVRGIFISMLAALLCGFAPNPTILLILRVFQGFGGALYSGAGLAIVISVFPPGERGKVLGITTASVYLGLSFGPSLGGFLTEHLGWRSVFFFSVLIYLCILYLIVVRLKAEWIAAPGEKFDYIGAVISSLAIFSVVYGFTRTRSSIGMILLGAGMILLIAFILWEKRFESPLVNLTLFTKSRTFTFSNIAALINYSATFGVAILMSYYLQEILGLSPQNAGIVLLVQPVAQALLSPLAGRLSDRIDPQVVASIGIAITTIGLAMFIFLTAHTELYYILFTLLILGIGFAFFSSPNTNAVMSAVEKKYLGVASSLLATMRVTGQTLSISISTLIFALYLGKEKITVGNHPRFIKAITISFTVFTILSFLAIFASLARGKTANRGS